MKTVIASLIFCATFCCAQEAQTEPQGPKTQEVKRLSSVTWNLENHKLVWMVEKGSIVDGEFVPSSKVKYEVSPDEAFMAYAGEQRALGQDEASSLHELLNVLSLYCVESVVWWDHGGADTQENAAPTAPGLVTKPGAPASSKPAAKPDEKVVKVASKEPSAAPEKVLAMRGK